MDPVVIDAANPAFSWRMGSDAIRAAQKTYQFIVRDEAGESATFANYKLGNRGKFARGTLLDASTGATYAIFEVLGDGIPEALARPGQTLTLRFAEILYPELEEYISAGVNGMLMVENLRSALVTDFYTMKEGENVFAPDLIFHGCRYIEISGLDEALPQECVQLRVLSSLDATANYGSSNALTNQLFANIVNSTTSSYISISTDCPQRDGRMG